MMEAGMGKRVDITNELIASLDEAADIMAGKTATGRRRTVINRA
jgi:hypothetical protein